MEYFNKQSFVLQNPKLLSLQFNHKTSSMTNLQTEMKLTYVVACEHRASVAPGP